MSAAGATKASTSKPDDLGALLRGAKTWAYQLQGIDAARLRKTSYDVLVLDAGSGAPGSGLSSNDIRRLKRKPDGSRRVVLAYLSIGEAEDYRSYWKSSWERSSPEWMAGSNERWKGDHRVRFWHPEWRNIVFGNDRSIIARLIERGYDGAYMDRVDVYYFFCGERPTAFDDMVTFVEDLSRWAKARKPGFLILPQNGEELLQSERYRASIDGLGKEDYVFGDRGNDVQNFDTRIERARDLIRLARKDRLPVLAVEYARKPENHAASRRFHEEIGSVLYFGPRSLAYVGQSGPRHAEDGDSEPYYAIRGHLGCGG